MQTPDEFRAGILYEVLGLPPTTVRTWPLSLGKAEEGKHPRYTDRDVVLGRLMRQLTVEMGLPAAVAGHIVETVADKIVTAYLEYVSRCQSNGEHRLQGGPYLLVEARRFGGRDWSRTGIKADLVQEGNLELYIGQYQNGPGFNVLHLRRFFSATRMKLSSALERLHHGAGRYNVS